MVDHLPARSRPIRAWLSHELLRTRATLVVRWLQEYADSTTLNATAAAPTRLREGVTLDNVGFSYPGRDEESLSEVSVTLAAGTTVAIVGENGAGKTTLIKILSGMYPPSSGRVTIDGVDLTTIDPVDWRRQVTGAFQDFLRLNMSIGDGVGAGDLPRIGENDIVRGAIDKAGASALLETMPGGLETLLGAYVGGRSLSGGEWRRLALARGLMRDAPLLVVLDEPTASLHAPTEAALFARYRDAASRLGQANGAVTVLVSHRFSTVHMADQIVVMEKGAVKEVGAHKTLMAAGGLYAELYELQARGYRPSVGT
jgi:ATP-binding cassette, subfamily B, bacterial